MLRLNVPTAMVGHLILLSCVLLGSARGQDVEFVSRQLVHVGVDKSVAEADETCAPRHCGWTFSAGYLLMERARPDSTVLFFDTAAPARNLNAENIDFGFEPGWELSARYDGGETGTEIRLMSLDAWEGHNRSIVGGPSLVRLNTAVPFDLPNVTAVDSAYGSDLLSLEYNRRRHTGVVTWIAGFRYIELDELFHATADAAAVITVLDVATANRMYGLQFGAEGTLWQWGRVTVEGIGKAGIYYNSGRQNSRLDTGIAVVTSADRAENAAFVGELGINGVLPLNDCWSLRTSYNLIWVAGAVLASDQIPSTDFFSGQGIRDDDVLYHGFLASLEYRH